MQPRPFDAPLGQHHRAIVSSRRPAQHDVTAFEVDIVHVLRRDLEERAGVVAAEGSVVGGEVAPQRPRRTVRACVSAWGVESGLTRTRFASQKVGRLIRFVGDPQAPGPKRGPGARPPPDLPGP